MKSKTGLRAMWRNSASYPGYLVCSNCNDCYIDREWLEDGKWIFCPTCGARMMGAESEAGKV